MKLPQWIRAPFAQPKVAAPAPVALVDAGDLIEEFRAMIDKGQGGARGLSAPTRVAALRGLAILGERDPEGALSLARVATRGERSQGEAVANLVAWGRLG